LSKYSPRPVRTSGELAGEPAAGVDVTRQALIHVPYSRSMRILIIGGTRFVGQAMAQSALDAGHDVTLLHRHATDELPGATHLLADRDGDLSVLDGVGFDATIDVCAYVPAQVRRLHDALDGRGGHHLFISTVSVYQEPEGPGAGEDSPRFAPAPEDATEVTNESYGPMKVTCEDIATELYGEAGLAIVRPTYVVGPRDMTARYPWWPLRARPGGSMIAPGYRRGADGMCIDRTRTWARGRIRLARPRDRRPHRRRGPAPRTFGHCSTRRSPPVDSDASCQVDGDWLVEQGTSTDSGSAVGPRQPRVVAGDGHRPRAEAAGLLTHRHRSRRPCATRSPGPWPTPDQSTEPELGPPREREQELLEAWFATQDDARSSGWTASRRRSSPRCRRWPCAPARSTSARVSRRRRAGSVLAAADGAAQRRQPVRPGTGVPALRQAIARHQQRHYGLELDPDRRSW
jgi:2'-hydroxyisoflavone reductase